MAPRLSVVVPVGPGDEAWRGLLERLAGLREVEVVVVFPEGDGEAERGSPARRAPASLPNRFGEPAGARLAGDQPPTPPQSPLPASDPDAPVRHLTAPRGRATQQNAGARAAAAPLLWFLHADSQPDDLALATAQSLDAGSFDALGWFRLAFHDGGAAHRLNALGANLRSRIAGLPFGDQGLLLPAARLRALGGFDESLPLGEDLDLVVRARRAGLRLAALDGTVATSARRYREQGWARTTLRHLALTWRLARKARRRIADGAS